MINTPEQRIDGAALLIADEVLLRAPSLVVYNGCANRVYWENTGQMSLSIDMELGEPLPKKIVTRPPSIRRCLFTIEDPDGAASLGINFFWPDHEMDELNDDGYAWMVLESFAVCLNGLLSNMPRRNKFIIRNKTAPGLDCDDVAGDFKHLINDPTPKRNKISVASRLE